MFRRKRGASDFTAEIETHIQMETERLREQGLSEEEARAAARRAFGNVTQAQERFYESSRWLPWDYLSQDILRPLNVPESESLYGLQLATWIPAQRALSIEPTILLREE